MHIHNYYCNTSRYNYKLYNKKLIFKCVCGKEITSKFREMCWKIEWFIEDKKNKYL